MPVLSFTGSRSDCVSPDAGDLDEDDLALLEENTGMKLTRGDGVRPSDRKSVV